MSKASAWGLAALAAGLLMSGCGGGSSYGSSPTSMPTVAPNPPAAADVVITITGINGGMSFSPSPATMKAGQTVAWKNSGGTTHTATADGGAFDTGAIADGATSAPITMSTAGTFTYHCTFHPSMVGTLTVSSGAGY
jgi:plastocyanin